MQIKTGFHSGANFHSRDLPAAFCWTKMGDEAGQSLKGILARKDAERQLGDGLFFWGIGSSLGQKMWSFLENNENPDILFSPMKSQAKKMDVKPDRIFAWTSYLDRHGKKHKVPAHAVITSRGTTGAKVKKFHYALVCHKAGSFTTDVWPTIAWKDLRNYQSRSRLGFSQVTSLVEVNTASMNGSATYKVLFGAKMVSPHFVTLVDPVEIPKTVWANVNHGWTNLHYDVFRWKTWILENMPKFRMI